MINIFNSPIDPSQLEEFAEGKQEEDGDQKKVFDVSYSAVAELPNFFHPFIHKNNIDMGQMIVKKLRDFRLMLKKRKPQVTYNSDGRRMLDGVVENQHGSNALWSTAISRGVANEWREEATGTRLQKTKRYIYKVSYDAQLLVRQTYRRHATAILIATNVTLFLLFLYICRLFPFNR